MNELKEVKLVKDYDPLKPVYKIRDENNNLIN